MNSAFAGALIALAVSTALDAPRAAAQAPAGGAAPPAAATKALTHCCAL